MIVRRIPSTEQFATLVDPLAAADPVGYSILTVAMGRVLRGEIRDPDVVWWVAEEAGEVVAAGQHLVPYFLGLHGVPDALAGRLAGRLVDLFLALGRLPVGAAGPTEAVQEFTSAWCSVLGCRPRVSRRLGRWVLDELVPPTNVRGRPRRPRPDEAVLVQAWVDEFHQEVGSAVPQPPDWAVSRVAAGTLVMWEVDGEPVALAGRTAAEAGVARVGPVWTPVDERGHGYGSAVTAAVTQAALDDGADAVCLYTDLANPISNAIYARLGYRQVGEEIEVGFESLRRQA